MDAKTRRYINDLAERVLEVYDISIPITNIEEVVAKMGGTIVEEPEFDDLCDGTIKKDGSNGFRIAISPYQSKQRKAFTIAHELGHLFLHMGFQTDHEKWSQQKETTYRRFGLSEQEFQANEFAAALLMPKDRYLEVLMEYTEETSVDIQKVAEYFHVSVAAATNRGKFLGYLA